MGAPWYEALFDERYLTLFPALKQNPVAPEDARFVAECLALAPGSRILDLGCGTGRHSVALAEMGMAVTGLDLSAALLEQARQTAAVRNADVSFVQRDMRDLDGLGPFDACISMYTAFGFFGDEEDQEVLHQVSACLAPEGRFLLDLTNFIGYLRRFPGDAWFETSESVVRERSTYDASRGILTSERSCFLKGGGSLDVPPSEVRAYLPNEIRTMLRRAGFHVEKAYGTLRMTPFDWRESPNQVYVCRKTATDSSDCRR